MILIEILFQFKKVILLSFVSIILIIYFLDKLITNYFKLKNNKTIQDKFPSKKDNEDQNITTTTNISNKQTLNVMLFIRTIF